MNYMTDVFERLPARLLQGVAMLLALLVVALLCGLGIASVQLARVRQSLRPLLAQEMKKALGRDVRVGAVSVQGFNRVIIRDTEIARTASFSDGTALTVPRTEARINLIAYLLHREDGPLAAIRRITLQRPALTVNRNAAGEWDFQDILDRLAAQRTTQQAWKGQLLIAGGDLSYRDAHTFGTAHPFRQRLVDVRARVQPARGGSYGFVLAAHGAQRNIGRIEVAGQYSGTGDTRVDLTANRVAMKEIARYLPAKLPITFEDGTAAFRLSALFTALPAPHTARRLSPAQLTAEVDLSGVGLRLDELKAPIVATSGRLRLVHNRAQYPRGSRLELVNVRARAAKLPIRLSGSIADLNLFDLQRLNPRFDLRLSVDGRDGSEITGLFLPGELPRKLSLNGPISADARVTGRPGALQIAGTLHSARVRLYDFAGNDAHIKFHARPSARAGQPTIEASAKLHDARVGNSTLDGLALTLRSTTPWRQLERDPHFTGDAEIAHLRFPGGETERVSGTLQANKRGVRATELTARMLGGTVQGTADFPFHSDDQASRHFLQADLRYRQVELAQLARLLRLDGLTGRGSGTVQATIDADRTLRLRTELAATAVQYRNYQASALRTTLTSTAQRGTLTLDIAQAQAETEQGQFTITDGRYTRTGTTGTLHLPLRGERVRLDRFGYDDLRGLATLQGTVTGRLDAPELTGTVQAGAGALQGHAFAKADAEITIRPGAVLLRNLTLARAGMTLEVPGGDAGFNPSQDMAGLQATLRLHGAPVQEVLNVFELASPWKIEGGTQGTVAIVVTSGGVTLDGGIVVPQAVVHVPTDDDDYPLRLDRLAADFTYADRVAEMRSLRFTRGSTTTTATGRILAPDGEPLSAEMTFASEAAQLQELPLDLFGLRLPLTGNGEFSGTLRGVLDGTGKEPLRVTMRGSAPQLRVAGVPVGKASTELTYAFRPDDRQLSLQRLTLEGAPFQAEMGGEFLLSKEQMRNVYARVDRFDLAALRAVMADTPEDELPFQAAMILGALPQELAGTGQLRLDAQGSTRKPQLGLAFTLQGMRFGAVPLPDVQARLSASNANGRYRLQINEAVARGGAGEGEARVAGSIAPDGNLDLRFSAKDITSKLLTTWAPHLPAFGGSIAAQGTARGSWQRPALAADVSVQQPEMLGHTLHALRGHISTADGRLELSNGEIVLSDAMPPLRVDGHLPLRWDAPLRPAFPTDGPIALQITVPQQSLTPLSTVVPELSAASGTIAGALHIAGTLAEPYLASGELAVAGSATLPTWDRAYPNRLDNLDLRLAISGNRQRSTVKVERFMATLDRWQGGARDKEFTPGWLAAEGAVTIPSDGLLTPDAWQWDVYSKLVRLPLSPALFMVPHVSGFAHLVTENGQPTLQGVLLVEDAKIREPKMTNTDTVSWGPFTFNPRLSLVLQVGERVKMAKSIFRIPLRSTPLPRPGVPSVLPGVNPNLQIAREAREYAYNASMLNPGTAAELPGTWGVVTGSLQDPRLYVRFEVDKKKLSFPLNLIGSVRRARGHVTFNLADGPQIVMGIPDFPAQPPSPTPAQARAPQPAPTTTPVATPETAEPATTTEIAEE